MDASVKGPAPEVAGAKKGGTLTITNDGAPPTFDPAGAYYLSSMAVLSDLVTRGLTGYQNANGANTLVPDMAEGLGKQSPDGLTWTFKVKKGLKYSDGQPVKAADFVYAIERDFDEDLGGNGPVPYLQTYLVDGKTYKGPIKDKNAKFGGVTAPDDSTVVFHLTQKWPTLPYYLAFPAASPVPKSAEKGAAYQNNPLATGPYKYAKFTKGQSIELVKNSQWDAKSDPIRHQFPDKIIVKLAQTPLTVQQRILSNTGAGATTVDTSSTGAVAAVLPKEKTQPKQFVTGPSSCESYLPLDTKKIPLAVRKAIAIAYPYDQTRKAQGLASNLYDPATTYAPPQIPGIKQYPPINGLTGKGPGDPAMAKAMLKKAGHVGFKLSWFYKNDDPALVASNTALKKAMTDAGFKVTDTPVSKDSFSDKTSNPKASQNVGQGISSWCYDWPSGDSVYPQLFSSSTADDGRSVGNLHDAAVDKELKRISAMDPTAAGPQWLAFDKKMAQQVVGIPLSYGKNDYVIGNKVHNVVNDTSRSMPDFSQIWVS